VNSPDKDWWTAQAGEYVLGTLSHSDRVTFIKAAEHETQAQEQIANWENTFQPLADSLEPVEPPSSVWDAIAARVNELPQHDPSVISLDSYKAAEQHLETKVNRWRTFAGLAAVASIALASLTWIMHSQVQDQTPDVTTASVTQYDAIAIIRNEQDLPLWVVDSALGDGVLRVTAIAPPAIDDTKDYQLWLVKPDDAGVQSMALISSNSDQSDLINVDVTSEKPVAFAVSLEEAGGSTRDGPTGPVLYQGVVQSLTL